MNECLKVKKNNCKNCYKCIRNCPIKAISFNLNQASIVQDECVLCGRCYVCCPQHAKVIRDDLPTAKRLLEEAAPVYASIAPSFAAGFPGVSIEAMKEALCALGFDGVEETAVGATIVKAHYQQLIDSGVQPIVISSCCHTVNVLIQRYYPEALKYLAKVQSPMQAHSASIKREHPGVKTVFFGPCISKKDEADKYPDIVDCVISFEGLSAWLAAEGVELHLEEVMQPGGRARLFPVEGGIIRSLGVYHKDYRYLTICGMDQCMAALEDICAGRISDRCFIEMSACEGSCIGGPVMSSGKFSPISSALYIEKQAGNTDFQIDMPDAALLDKTIAPQPVHTPKLDEQTIAEALLRIGKSKPEDELDCGSCGYDTCREKVVATISGKSEEVMCMPYLMERAQSFSDIIISNSLSAVVAMNEKLQIQQINAAGCRLFNIGEQKKVLGKHISMILDPEPFLEVLETSQDIHEQKVYLAEYAIHVSLSVIHDTTFHVVLAIMRDITEKETAREIKEARDQRTIEITDKVIEKQMATVQEIASLLGETTAETKIALSKLKETLRNE